MTSGTQAGASSGCASQGSTSGLHWCRNHDRCGVSTVFSARCSHPDVKFQTKDGAAGVCTAQLMSEPAMGICDASEEDRELSRPHRKLNIPMVKERVRVGIGVRIRGVISEGTGPIDFEKH